MSERGLVGDLIDNLRTQHDIYKELFELSKSKKDIIVRNDIDALREITAAENGLIGRSQRLERDSDVIIADISDVLGEADKAKVDFAYITELLESQGRPEAQEIKSAASALRFLLEEMREVNDFNRELVQGALDYIDYSMNVIRSSRGEDNVFADYSDIARKRL
jgi:flagellar biosynthesis/type III secretory pathway chaperone